MTKRLLSFVLAALMVFSMMPAIFAANKNTHQVSDDAEPTIEIKNTNFVSYLGIIKGYPNGSLGLEDPVTRWMMALLAIRVMTGDVDDTSWLPDITYTTRFEDVTDGDVASLYLGAIALCADNGFIRGIEENGKLYFKPYDTITYVDALVIAVRLLGYESDEMNAGYPTTYTEKAYALGLNEGISGVALKDEVTREVAFQLIYNVLFAKRANSDKTFQEENFPYHTVKFVCTNTGEVLKTYTVVHGSTLYQSTGLTPEGFSNLRPGRPSPSAVYYSHDDGVYWSLDPYGENKLAQPSSKNDRNHFARNAAITEDTTIYVYYPERDTKVEFVDADGNVIKTINGKGAFTVYTSDYPDLPANTAKYTYTGWSKTGMFTVDDTTVRVTAVSKTNQYDVTFVDKDGKQIGETQKVAYGTCPAYPTAPEVEGMSFAGWSVTPGTAITENTTIKATYDVDPVVWFDYVDANGTPIASSQKVYLKKGMTLSIPDAKLGENYKFNKIEISGIDAKTLDEIDSSCVVKVIYKTASKAVGYFSAGVLGYGVEDDENGNITHVAFKLAEGVDLSGLINDAYPYTNNIRYGVTLWDGVIDSADDVVAFAYGKFYSAEAAEYDDSYVAVDAKTLDANISYSIQPTGALYALYLFDNDGDGDYDYAYTFDYQVASYIDNYLITYYGVQLKNGAIGTVQGKTMKTDAEFEVGSWMYIAWDELHDRFDEYDVLYSEAAKDMAKGNITAASAITMTFTFDNGETYNLTNDYAAGYTFEGITADEVKAFLNYNFTREPGDPDREYYYYSFDGMLVYLAEFGALPFIIEEDLSEDELGDIYVVTDVLFNDEYDLEQTVTDSVYKAYKNGSNKVAINALSYYEFYYWKELHLDYHELALEEGDFFMLQGKIVVVDPLIGKGVEFYLYNEIVHAYDESNDLYYDYPYSDGTDCAQEYIEFKYYFDLEASKAADEDVYNFGFTAWEYKEGFRNDQTNYRGGFISDDATFVISFGTKCFFEQYWDDEANHDCDCPGCQLANAEGIGAQRVVVLTGKDLRTAWEKLVNDYEGCGCDDCECCDCEDYCDNDCDCCKDCADLTNTWVYTVLAGHVWYYDAENEIWMIKADTMYLGDVDLGFTEYEAVDGDYVFMLPSFAKDGILEYEDAADGEHTIYTYNTTGLFDFYTGADYTREGLKGVKSYIDFTKVTLVPRPNGGFEEHKYALENAMHKGYVMTIDEDGYAWFTEVSDSDGVKYTLAFELLRVDEDMDYNGWMYSLEYIFNETTANRNFVIDEDYEIPTFNMFNRLRMLSNTIDVNELLYNFGFEILPSNVKVSVNMPYEGVDYTKLSDFFTDNGKSLIDAVAKIAQAFSENYEFFCDNYIYDFYSFIKFFMNNSLENFTFEFEDYKDFADFLKDILKDVVENQTLITSVESGKNGDVTYVEINSSIGVVNLMKLMFDYDLTGENAVTNDLSALINVVFDVAKAIYDKQIASWTVYDYVEYKITKAFADSAAATAANSVIENVQFYNYDKENDTYVEYDLVDGVDYYVQYHDFYNILWVYDAETNTLRGYFRDAELVSAEDYDFIEIVADGYVDLTSWVEYSQKDGEYAYGYDYAHGIYDYINEKYLTNVDYYGEDFEAFIAKFRYTENVHNSVKVEWLVNVTFDEKGNAVPVYEETDVILAYFVEDEDDLYVAIANNDFYADPYTACTFGFAEYRITVTSTLYTFSTNDTDTVKFTFGYTPTDFDEKWVITDGYQNVNVNITDEDNGGTTYRVYGIAELKEAFENGEVTRDQLKNTTWGGCPNCKEPAHLAFDKETTLTKCEHCGEDFVGTYTTERWIHINAAAKADDRKAWHVNETIGVQLYDLTVYVAANEDGTMPEVTVTIDGEAFTNFEVKYDEFKGDNGTWYFVIPKASITGDIVVTVAE